MRFPKVSSDKEEQPIMNIEQIDINKFDKYRDKAIRFYKKNDHYDLIFGSDFEGIDQNTPIYADLLLDLKDADKGKEIHVWIHSCGGDCSTLMLISQQLDEFEYVVTIGLGQIDSAGFLLWCKGDERYLAPTTFCMYHGLSTGNFGKANELKEFSVFIEKYQDIFEECVKQILTEEQMKKGRYTELWFLGKELIERGKAIDYKFYKKRSTLTEIQAFVIQGDAYVKNENNFYLQINSDGEELTRKQVMKRYLIDNKKIEESNKKKEEIGENYLEFFVKLFEIRGNSLTEDGFMSYEYLMESWKGFSDEKIALSKLLKKLEKWIKDFTINLEFKKDIEKNGCKGFTVKVIQEEEEK